jgi:hypothetical protein
VVNRYGMFREAGFIINFRNIITVRTGKHTDERFVDKRNNLNVHKIEIKQKLGIDL